MAGIWETWSSNGTEIQSVAIITTEANDVVAELHDRMPVILVPDEEQRWLTESDVDELQRLLDAFPERKTRSWDVSRAVNNPGNDGPELFEPIGSDQAGLEEFG